MILLLAGTAEARRLAALLHEAGVPATASLAGATRDPAPLALPTRVGGFGGAAGLASHIAGAGVTAIIDATHPFALRISDAAAEAAHAAGVPLLRLDRPAWARGEGDRWAWAADEAEVARLVPPNAVVLLATGGRSLGAWQGLRAARVVARAVDPPGDVPPGVEVIMSRPPHDLADESALLSRLGVTHLVTKDAGGPRARLDAARALGVEVILLRRPPTPPGIEMVATPEAALDWALARAHVPRDERA